jgi:hypothetical protein
VNGRCRNAPAVLRFGDTDPMCCFSIAQPAGWFRRVFPPAPVHVSKTNIFARMIEPGRQALAYGMNLKAKREVAMVLPLPVPPGSGEEAVTFVDLKATPKMFDELAALFLVEQTLAAKGGPSRFAPQSRLLVVHKVGSFVASYVPTRADFKRLDPRFRIPEVLFDAVPAYADYGFAVFQLEPGDVTVHPMGMTFPTRDERVFFPTVHVHDGRFHATAAFDHALYYQHAACTKLGEPFRGDDVALEAPKPYAGLTDVARPIARRTLRGKLANEDTWV